MKRWSCSRGNGDFLSIQLLGDDVENWMDHVHRAYRQIYVYDRSSLSLPGAKLLCYQSILRQVIPKWKRDHERLAAATRKTLDGTKIDTPIFHQVSKGIQRSYRGWVGHRAPSQQFQRSKHSQRSPNAVCHTYADTQARIYLDSSKPMHPDTLSARTSRMQ